MSDDLPAKYEYVMEDWVFFCFLRKNKLLYQWEASLIYNLNVQQLPNGFVVFMLSLH